MSKSLNTENVQSLLYQNDLLKLTVLGGIKLEGLDRLRATLKVELKDSSRPAVRHNLDLYNDTQLEKFIRKVAERLEIGTSVIAASLSELTEQLEQYRLAEQKKQETTHYQAKVLSQAERKAAEKFLKCENLLTETNKLIGASGVIGETNNRLLMYLIFTSRKTKNPLHVVSLAASGSGKTYLQEKVGQLIPAAEKREITTLSENAFYYFGQQELSHKLILIEDLDGAESVLYPLRELQSKKRISKTVVSKNRRGETRSHHLLVEGPVCVGGTTTKERIYEDNANRSFLIYLDESEEQDEAIMDYQRKLSAGKIDKASESVAAKLLRDSQQLLLPIKVVNPYAEQLKIPQSVLKPRRTNTHYLAFIELVTYYHQYQRKQEVDKETGEIYITTTLSDIKAANEILKETLIRKSDRLTGACRAYFEKLKSYLQDRDTPTGSPVTNHPLSTPLTTFTNRELSLHLKISLPTVKRYHLDLYNAGMLQIEKKDKLKGYQYKVVSYEEYVALKANIHTVLEDTYAQLLAGEAQLA